MAQRQSQRHIVDLDGPRHLQKIYLGLLLGMQTSEGRQWDRGDLVWWPLCFGLGEEEQDIDEGSIVAN